MLKNSIQTTPSPQLKCLVISCPNYETPTNNSTATIKFFKFPSEIDNRQLALRWKEKCGVAADHDIRESKVCSKHFTIDAFSNRTRTKLKPDAIPKENLDWMFGAPEIRTGPSRNNIDENIYPSSGDLPLIHHDRVVECVDENQRLKQRLNQLEIEFKLVARRLMSCNNKIKYAQCQLQHLNRFISTNSKRNYRKLRKIDSNLLTQVFSQAQINILVGKKKRINWDDDDLATAFTLRHLGGRELYLYLKNTLNYPLPALSAVQRWAASNQ